MVRWNMTGLSSYRWHEHLAYVVLGPIPPRGALVEEAEALGGVEEGGQQHHRVLQHRGALTRDTVTGTCHDTRVHTVSRVLLRDYSPVVAGLVGARLVQAGTGPQYILHTDQLSMLLPPLKLRLSSCLFA